MNTVKNTSHKIFMVLLLMTCIGCSRLHKTQTKAIHHYYETMNNYVEYTETVNQTMAEAKINHSQLFPSTYSAKNQMIDSLILSFQNYQKEVVFDSDLNQKLDSLDLHIKEYFLIIPNGFKVLKILEGTSVVVGNVFGLGRYVSSAFSNAKDFKITPKNAKKLIIHIEKGTKITEEASKEIDKYLEKVIHNDVNQEKENLKTSYISFLKGLREKSDSYEYYSKYNTIFIKNYKRLYFVELLAKQLEEANQLVLVSQKELIEKTKIRKKLNQDLESIQKLYIKVNDIKKNIKRLEEL